MYNALMSEANVAVKNLNTPSATRVAGEHAPARSARVVSSSSSSSSSRLRINSYAGVWRGVGRALVCGEIDA